MSRWFGVSILYEGTRSQADEETLWEEVIVIVHAVDEDDASSKAAARAAARETSFVVQGGDTVRWVFREVERVCSIEDASIRDGSEVLSRFLTASEAASLRTKID